MAIIDKPSDYFNTALYTGNGTSQSITSLDFQPDLTWIKGRSDVIAHVLFDSVRGAGGNKEIGSNVTYAEGGNASISYGFLSSFNSDGFSVSQGTSSPYQADYTNKNSSTYASWNWKAGGTAVSNTVGDIASSVSANQDAGFSIVTYTGTGANATVGHGLGAAPRFIITKRLDSGSAWFAYSEAIPNMNTGFMTFSEDGAFTVNSTIWNNTSPTSSVVSIGTSPSINASSGRFVLYCFAEKQGFSKFGSYTGNGSADGTFVYTGFKPAFVMVKRTDTSGNWIIWDNKRNNDTPAGANYIDLLLYPNASDAEVDTGGAYFVDILSNGFKLRGTGANSNASGGTYIYLAIAEQSFVTSTDNGSIPATAR
jgi:hypothetical protein